MRRLRSRSSSAKKYQGIFHLGTYLGSSWIFVQAAAGQKHREALFAADLVQAAAGQKHREALFAVDLVQAILQHAQLVLLEKQKSGAHIRETAKELEGTVRGHERREPRVSLPIFFNYITGPRASVAGLEISRWNSEAEARVDARAWILTRLESPMGRKHAILAVRWPGCTPGQGNPVRRARRRFAHLQRIERETAPVIMFTEDGKRPYVDKYGIVYRYRPADQGWLTPAGTNTREGPYYISEAKGGMYSLCNDAWQSLKDGQFFSEGELALYNPFA
ncbi:uncharacterized protein PG986_012478 [Apiospora aurea]|uniref:Uncharacterized protein n=1 Tax=Apiospora aurea TaxID=335848 RepID=A0ABR1Q051_9PEZI